MTKSVPDHGKASAIDWENIRESLKKVQRTFEAGYEISDDKKRAILKARARDLAQEPVHAKIGEHRFEVLEFLLADETYAVEASYIREVYPLKEFTPLPCTPPFLLGVVNVRGRLLSVIDIKKFFDLPEKGLTNLNRIIIVGTGRMELGILSDEIVGLRVISGDDLQRSLPTLSGIRREYLKGVTGEGVIVLEPEKLLSDRQIVIHEEVET